MIVKGKTRESRMKSSLLFTNQFGNVQISGNALKKAISKIRKLGQKPKMQNNEIKKLLLKHPEARREIRDLIIN